MDKEIPKTYDQKQESELYKLWESSGYFNPDNLQGEPFSMVLPPPNVTGTLHVGHALTVTIEDIMVRYQRMLGKKTLWLPGTDHAAIATETKFLKENKNIRRSDYKNNREEFIKMVDKYALNNQTTIINQLRKIGASLDWSRPPAFTLDEKRKRAVKEAFIRMYNAGLIYNGEYLVNWDVKSQTTVSDEETVYEAVQGILYTFRYSKNFPIPIATTRPETKIGDVAVAVNPNDNRYMKFVNKEYDVEFADTKLKIKIIADETIDPEFGTGAVGITPAHSKIDWEIAERHGLPKNKQVINEYGKIIHSNTVLNDKVAIKEGRERIVQWIKDQELLEKEEIIQHNIAKAQRSGGQIEVLPKRHQFFVNVSKPITERGGKTLKELMRDPVASKKIKILPERFEKVYFHWIDNLRDWNISRQVWYGHVIPNAWYNEDEIKISEKSPGKDWHPIKDTLDTWFSSGLWTFSTLGWPDQTDDLKLYHPTDVLETGYDILFFWVARMILMSQFLLGEIPFKTVYLHGLVRDKDRQKMSKSKGNVVDPLSITDKYGVDALRMALVVGNLPGADLPLSEGKIKGYRNFANKIWNAARFVIQNTEDQPQAGALLLDDQAILNELAQLVADTTKLMEKLDFAHAAENLYHYFWHTFADKIIEESKSKLADKKTRASAQKMLLTVLETSLKMLHPFMPFVTEAIWQINHKDLLMVAKWPTP